MKVPEAVNNFETLQAGVWRDVFCTYNKVYYEAQVKATKRPILSNLEEPVEIINKKENRKKSRSTDSEVGKVFFHFQGWSSKFDEWVDIDSDRIQPHNLFTNPNTNDPREQEKWQGLYGINTVIRSAVKSIR
jgi:hypothetical protein